MSLKDLLKKYSKIIVTSHILPDGDAMGSILGFGRALRLNGFEVVMYLKDKPVRLFSFFPDFPRITSDPAVFAGDSLIIALDTADPERLGEEALAVVTSNPQRVINIDHHISNTYFGVENIVVPEASATCEILPQIHEDLGLPWDEWVAAAYYAGITLDTGSFQYTNTTAKSFAVASFLAQKGFDLAMINEKLYMEKPRDSVLLFREALNSLTFEADGKIAWVKFTREQIERFIEGEEVISSIASFVRGIAGVEISILFRETRDGSIKVGFRSKTIDVNEIAAKFGGGGHKKASGCTLKMPLADAVEQVLAEVKKRF
ncbi:DHH family phosphoesterase [Carboxydothermus hydrogenoformans]|uniref:DHH/DHHA1 family protein n=1 Tax=Carboxydothermus hydrogenoformans (strain ATCC BAA-161 / DSM 6008 / Z-2901) TaxID=246194 RepID=Q3ABA0_CARHZ|nr:bifunctional oligoribonuclease/PAP phosphatase NrnA [Carboxydothermus hydrogenoformans]ABB13728.1 DHH/DHHA1 family protein [Carboxydothermus hydrogenoformans Z-2901]